MILVDLQTSKADQEVCTKHNITVEVFQELLEKYDTLPNVVDMISLVDENNQNISNGKTPDFKLEYPKSLTQELYLEILETVLEVLRHEAYWRLRYRIRQNSGSKFFRKLSV